MKKYTAHTPSRRHMTTVSYKDVLTTDEPYKPLVKGRARAQGRNAMGRITMRHRGGGAKRRYRKIDFRYDKKNIPATVETIEYDPNRSAFISLVCYADGERRYIIAPKGLAVGSKFVVGEDAPITVGNRLPLRRIPVGTRVHNIELKPGGGAKIVRSAGSSAEVLGIDAGYALLKMPSSEVRRVHENCYATVGEVSNEEHNLVTLGKAGRARQRGRRPVVRGAAMNPVDHPHGGGEGRAGRGHRRQRTKWGKPAGKGQKTRRVKKYSDSLIVVRRRVGKRRG